MPSPIDTYAGDQPHEKLKANIEALLKKRGFSWSKLGRKADLSGSMISALSNLRSTPSLTTICKLAGALGVKPSEFLKGVKGI